MQLWIKIYLISIELTLTPQLRSNYLWLVTIAHGHYVIQCYFFTLGTGPSIFISGISVRIGNRFTRNIMHNYLR